MNWKLIGVLLGCAAIMFLAASPASAQCVVNYSHYAMTPAFVGPFTSWVNLNAEGLTERPSDIVISGLGCFTTDSTLEIQYNAVMSVPTSFDISNRGTYWDFYDSTDSMSVDTVQVVQAVSSSGVVTKIQIHINLGTVNPTAEVIIKNLRFDVTGTTGPSPCTPATCYQTVPDKGYLNAYVGTSNPSSTVAGFPVGYVLKTIATAAQEEGPSVNIGFGFEDGVCPWSTTYCGYPSKGGTNGGFLIQRATFDFYTNPNWTTDFPFRYVGETFVPYVNDPHPIGQTDLVLDVEDIPSGVTVSLPTNLYICGAYGPLDTWTTSGTPSATGGSLVAVYKTISTTVAQGELVVTTNNQTHQTPVAPNGYSCSVTLDGIPNVIAVTVGDPSGNNADGNMVADLRLVMGPAPVAQFTGDDAQPSAIPLYLNYIGDTSQPTREIIGNNGAPVEYFYLNPTETVLLFPYVTNLMGWETGLEVANTGVDTVTDAKGTFSVFGNTGQTGALDFYTFPSASDSTATPYACTTALTSLNSLPTCTFGRGLNSAGNLPPGSDFADTLNDLLSAIGQGGATFDGYIIVVAHFNFAHGTELVFSSGGSISGYPALILGGHCAYNPSNAQPLPSGAPDFPACSSARQGDITKLPERLEN